MERLVSQIILNLSSFRLTKKQPRDLADYRCWLDGSQIVELRKPPKG